MPQRQITPAMVEQYNRKETGLHDPCIICRGNYLKCGHMDETPDLIARIKNLGKAGRDEILRRG